MKQSWYWLAINGASCAACPVPSPNPPQCIPVPQGLIGYPTLEEQQRISKFFLEAPLEEVRTYYYKGLNALLAKGEVEVIRFVNPEPPTKGETTWILGSKLEGQRYEALMMRKR